MIGSHLARAVITAGHEVTIVDNFSRGTMHAIDDLPKGAFEFIEGDLRDYETTRRVCRRKDTIYHLADVVSGIQYVFGNEYHIFRDNVQINSNLVRGALECNVENIIYAGTACSYPKGKQSVIGGPALRETDAYPADPESSYGWSKLIGEYEIGLATTEEKVQSLVLRFHNVFGPWCDVNPATSQVIPALCVKAAKNPRELVVWGSGKQRRAFLFVDDAVSALMLGLEKGLGQGVVQIGPEESISIGHVAQKIRRIVGKQFEIVFDTDRPEGDKDRFADFSKAKRVLGWSPDVRFDEGLQKTYEWISNARP
jgi:GDP-D-mannose 3', 5'-epimerase